MSLQLTTELSNIFRSGAHRLLINAGPGTGRRKRKKVVIRILKETKNPQRWSWRKRLCQLHSRY